MVGYGGKDLQKWKVLSLEWKGEGVMERMFKLNVQDHTR